MSHQLRVRVIGRGRAGGALAIALRRTGLAVDGPLGRDADTGSLAHDVDLVVLAVGDADIAPAARSIAPGSATVVHLAGSKGLDLLDPHPSAGALHPLVALPDPETGADRLAGAWFAVASTDAAADERVRALVAALGGHAVDVRDADRAAYHAAAVVAANHLTALLGQVERIAATVDVPLDAFLDLAQGALDNVRALGPRAALTGPVARDDWATVADHLAAIDPAERPAYAVLAEAARVLRDQAVPA